MLTPRTRTVLRLMLFTALRRAWTVVRMATLLVVLLMYMLGFLSINLLTLAVVEAAWPLRSTPLHAWSASLFVLHEPISLADGFVALVGMGVLAVGVFWGFVVRNRRHAMPNGPLIDQWILGLPKPGVSRASSWPDRLVMWSMSAFYMANAFAILLSFFMLMLGALVLGLLAGAWSLLGQAAQAWQRLRISLPCGVTVPTWQRVKARLTQAWDAQSQRMLDAHPQDRVALEQRLLHEAAHEAQDAHASHRRSRL